MTDSPAREPWLYLDSGPGEAAFNMAFDELLLYEAATLGKPVLRCYSWIGTPATFGYSQRWTEISEQTSLRPLVRRPTGGGLVLHDLDSTYSVVFPPHHPWTRLKARESYRQLHHWIKAAFENLGLHVHLAREASTTTPGVCFAGPEESDIVMGQFKIAGAAQRRNRSGLLIQGSAQPPGGRRARASFNSALRRTAEQRWVSNWLELPDLTRWVRLASVLANEKYSSAAHNQRR